MNFIYRYVRPRGRLGEFSYSRVFGGIHRFSQMHQLMPDNRLQTHAYTLSRGFSLNTICCRTDKWRASTLTVWMR